jgi:hypothetical protein
MALRSRALPVMSVDQQRSVTSKSRARPQTWGTAPHPGAKIAAAERAARQSNFPSSSSAGTSLSRSLGTRTCWP